MTSIGAGGKQEQMKLHLLQEEVQNCHARICHLSSKLEQQDVAIIMLKVELRKLLNELAETRTTLKDIAIKL